jgi:hypothetical protein
LTIPRAALRLPWADILQAFGLKTKTSQKLSHPRIQDIAFFNRAFGWREFHVAFVAH